MVQFTLGCVLLLLTIFFGGKELLANNDAVENRTKSLESQERKVALAERVKSNYDSIQDQTIVFSEEIKQNLINQLNIDETKHAFEITEPESKDKVLTTYQFRIEGFDEFPKVFNLIADIEKIKGLQLDDVCFNCEVGNKELIQRGSEIGFYIKGKAYVYNSEK